MKSALALAFLAAVFSAAPAQADVIPNTGTGGGTTDPNWSVSWARLGVGGTLTTESNAPLVPSVGGVWQANDPPDNNWIGATPTSTVPGGGSSGAHTFIYVFGTTVDVSGGSPEILHGALGYDNYFAGAFVGGSLDGSTGTFIGGTEFLSPETLLGGAANVNKSGFCRDGDGFLPTSSLPNCTIEFSVLLPAGVSKLNFVIEGDGTTDGFILNQQGVDIGLPPGNGLPPGSSIPEPGSLVLVGSALLGIRLARRRKPN